jgi:putative ABC transport system ATP-binding protein
MQTMDATRAAVAACAIDAVKIYGKGDLEVRALDGVTVDFPVRQLTAVMGPSGSGKSTLMHCLAGLDSLTSGTIRLGGIDLSTMTEKQRTIVRRDHVGFVFQAFNLVPTLTAMENIKLPADLGRRETDPEWLDRIVTAVGLRNRLDHRPSQLSGGEQQRVAMARALVGKPEIVFADEPTGNLDSRAAAEILSFLQRAVDELGQTIVMVTHDPNAASYGGRVLFLADGRIVGEMLDPTVGRVLERLKTLGD